MGHGGGLATDVMMEDVYGRYEELMGVLLLVPCQVSGVDPHLMEELERDVRKGTAWVKL